MTENLMIPQQELFEEIVKQALQEGVNNQEAYNQMVSDVIEEHRRVKELHDDQDLERIETEMQNRWPEYEERLNDRAV